MTVPATVQSVVVDTDVVSLTFKRDTRAKLYRPHLDGRQLTVSFMTIAELQRWALNRRWGERRRADLDRYLREFTVPAPCAMRGEVVNWGCRSLPPIPGRPNAARTGSEAENQREFRHKRPMPKWRNRQTRRPQKSVPREGSVGSTPTFGKHERTPAHRLQRGSRASAQECISAVDYRATHRVVSGSGFSCLEVIRQLAYREARQRHARAELEKRPRMAIFRIDVNPA
jgi:hypothetical protein